MPTPLPNAEMSDLEKVLGSLSFLASIRSFDDILVIFGLHTLPTAQKYGIFFGCITFLLTVTTVITLLVLGGSFKRIAEQADTGGNTIPSAIEARLNRPLLLERLIESQERMIKNYPAEKLTEGLTNLTKMLLNIAPDVKKATEVHAALIDEDKHKHKHTKIDDKTDVDESEQVKKRQEKLQKFIPDGYEANYIKAYRKCQDKPGGPILSGVPESRFEAYARAYAGCGIHTNVPYRRSYARIYESVAAGTHSNEKKYGEQWLERPGDIVGRMIRLEPLDVDRHLEKFFIMTNGDVYKENNAYEPVEIWGFEQDGPFKNPQEMRKSFVFQRKMNEAGFAIVESLTNNMVGVIMLTNDNPSNLTISLELPIVKPSSEGTAESIEACFLLMDRLFALGYRRIQLSIDSMDTKRKKLSGQLGFTQEGMILKDMVVKESNRDSIIYGMLNSDWDNGARGVLFKKLHGEKTWRADQENTKKEDTLDEQETFLAKQKEEEKGEREDKDEETKN
mmetsp:Transcript_7204/g.8208  ORF Transcript_7204/g.8208 Transcript_7204/m.8208 type:complete len:506 (-) Transcript_7204:181-1698(-)